MVDKAGLLENIVSSLLKKKKKPKDKVPGADMLSFASVMTIQLAFFIMLSTYSGRPEEERSRESIESFKSALQNFGMSDFMFGKSDSISNLVITLKRVGGVTREQETRAIKNTYSNLIDKDVEITYKREGDHLIFPTEIDFKGDNLELTPLSKAYLDDLIKLVKGRDCNINVSGYTLKNFVPTEEYPTSWQSSAAHATAVVKYLNSVGDIDHDRLTAVGYGKYQSLFSDVPTLNTQSKNRINIKVYNKEE